MYGSDNLIVRTLGDMGALKRVLGRLVWLRAVGCVARGGCVPEW